MVHPEVEKLYKEANYEQALERASDINERNFFEQAEAAKQPVKREITKIIRLKKAGVEHFYYGEELTSKDSLGNIIDHYRTVGKYDKPHFKYQVVEGKRVVSEVQSWETIYEYKWEDWTPELEELVSENFDLLIITPGRKYGGYTFIQFKESSFDDLITIGKFGTLNPVIINELHKQKQKVK